MLIIGQSMDHTQVMQASDIITAHLPPKTESSLILIKIYMTRSLGLETVINTLNCFEGVNLRNTAWTREGKAGTSAVPGY